MLGNFSRKKDLSRSADTLLTAHLSSQNVSNILGSEFELSNNNLNLLYEKNDAAKEDHKQDIIPFYFNHFKLWNKSVQKFNQYHQTCYGLIASTERYVAHPNHFQRNDILVVVVL
jgi:hypothetical protein